jgi:hypothetical protein
MDMLRLYYYTSMPLLTCNMLFYSITSLSTSISSSQNVVKFIAEHKDCDSIIFKNEIAETDLENKLRIIESLIYDIIKKFSMNNEEFERTKKGIQQPQITDTHLIENNEFALVEIKSPTTVLERIDEPIKLALISTSETVQNINALLMEMRDKINNHNKSYIKTILSISLQIELKNLNRQIKILDSRLHFLLELLKVYLPIREK